MNMTKICTITEKLCDNPLCKNFFIKDGCALDSRARISGFPEHFKKQAESDNEQIATVARAYKVLFLEKEKEKLIAYLNDPTGAVEFIGKVKEVHVPTNWIYLKEFVDKDAMKKVVADIIFKLDCEIVRLKTITASANGKTIE